MFYYNYYSYFLSDLKGSFGDLDYNYKIGAIDGSYGKKTESCVKQFQRNNNHKIDTLTALFETAQFTNITYIDSVLGYQSGCVKDNNIKW